MREKREKQREKRERERFCFFSLSLFVVLLFCSTLLLITFTTEPLNTKNNSLSLSLFTPKNISLLLYSLLHNELL